MIIREFCAENFTDVPRATAAGVERIELCDNLAVGGTTPSYGVIKQTAEFLAQTPTALSVLIRPRSGNFVYSSTELKIMEGDVLCAVEAGASGLVFGALTPENELDIEVLETLIIASQGLSMTFHMAFDELADSKKGLSQLIELGFDKVLLHGGPLSSPINTTKITELVAFVEDKIDLMLGGGVTAENFETLVNLTGVKFVHGTRII